MRASIKAFIRTLRVPWAHGKLLRTATYEVFVDYGQIRILWNRPVGAGRVQLHWDGRDDGGSDMPQGVYFSRVETPTGAAAARVVVIRR